MPGHGISIILPSLKIRLQKHLRGLSPEVTMLIPGRLAYYAGIHEKSTGMRLEAPREDQKGRKYSVIFLQVYGIPETRFTGPASQVENKILW